MNEPKAVSVRQRLLNRAKASGEDYNIVLARYVGLRFLHRLAASEHRDEFLIKGATLFLVWGGSPHRPTRDIDLLGFASPDVDHLKDVISTVCLQPVEPDGIAFEPSTVETSIIREENAYGGIRCNVWASLGSARQKLQIDVGFGDAIVPEPETVEIPRLLADEDQHHMKAYRFETAIAEKFEAMVSLGLANSRMKDFYDIEYLARTMSFENEVLAWAIKRTFERRRTAIPKDTPLPLSNEFWDDEMVQRRWKAFLNKNALAAVPLGDVCGRIWSFLRIPTERSREI